MDDRAGTFDRSLLEATLADAARAAEHTGDMAADSLSPRPGTGAPALEVPATTTNEVSLTPRAALSSVATMTGGPPRTKVGPPDAAPRGPELSLRRGVDGTPAPLPAHVAAPPLAASASSPLPVAPTPTFPDPAPRPLAGTPAAHVAADPTVPAGTAATPAASAKRAELRPFQASDDDLLPSGPNRHKRGRKG